MIFTSRPILSLLILLSLMGCDTPPPKKPGEAGYQKPNFLFIVSDDQSWQHTSFAGYPYVKTPNFDSIAEHGVYFENAYAAAPSCTASRSSILSGQYPWRLKSGAVIGGEWPAEIQTYPQILRQHGYHVGFTAKGWGPGYVNDPANSPDGQSYYREPRKKHFWELKTQHPHATSLGLFLEQKPKDQPFAFWIGVRMPHRPFEKGDVSRFSNASDRNFIPGFLPDTLAVREDLSAYLQQIEKYDQVLGYILDELENYDADTNTIIVVTSDNGMPFGRAKTQNYEYGVHVPLAISWKGIIEGGRSVKDMVGLYDIAPTFLAAANVNIPDNMNGKSLLDILYSSHSGQIDENRTFVTTMTERHSIDARPHAKGYPTRALYSKDYSLIKNYFPERWPSGDSYTEAEPQLLADRHNGQPLEPFFSYAIAKRPPIELYSRQEDPAQLHNLAGHPQYRGIVDGMRLQLESILVNSGDPLQSTGKDIFSTYPWAMR